MERELHGALSGQKHYQGLYESVCREYERLWSEVVAAAPPASHAPLSRPVSADVGAWSLEWIQGEDGFGAAVAHEVSITDDGMLEGVSGNG